MKKITFTLLALAITISAMAQKVVKVAPGPSGTLNTAIKANENAIYELKRGVPYLLNAAVKVDSGFTVTIRGEAGTGVAPIVLYGSPDGIQKVNQLFEVGGALKFEDLNMSCLSVAGVFQERLATTTKRGAAVSFNKCNVDNNFQAAVRVGSTKVKIYMTNSTFSRLGSPDNPDNGRLIDVRDANEVDTMWIQNCAVYNVTSRVVRNPTGRINWARFTQNTFANIGQRAIEFGQTKDIEFTNNIVANGYCYGLGHKSTNTQIIVDTVKANNVTENWKFTNNNFYQDAAVTAAIPKYSVNGDTLLTNIPVWDKDIKTASLSGNISEVLKYKNGPAAPIDFITDYHSIKSGTNNVRPGAKPWTTTGLTKDAGYSALDTKVDRFTTLYDFAYGTLTQSYKAGDKGQPIGVTTFGYITSASDAIFDSNIMAYPNPVSNDLYIATTDNITAKNITIYNINGQVVKNMDIDSSFERIDVSNLSSGIYMLHVKKESGKISVMKLVKE